MTKQVSIRSALSYGRQSLQQTQDSASLEAQILLAHCLQKDRSYLITWPDQSLSDLQWQQYQLLIEQRTQGKPVAYILGYKEFWSLNFKVSEATLIPRPETEHLVELALTKIPVEKQTLIADLGCGCGAVALAIAKERPASHVIATDISKDTIKIAKHNAATLNIANVSFIQTHWLGGFKPNCFDLIVSNPPYIEATDPHLQQGDLPYEPIGALASGHNGLQDIQTIIHQSPDHLKANAWLMLEHGYNQGGRVKQLLTQNHFSNVTCITDLSLQDRISLGYKPN